MKAELLEVEVELLLLKYGEASVLKAISATTGSSEDTIRKKLSILKEKKTIRKKSRLKKRPIDVAKDVVGDSANKEQLMQLAVSYQNRQFLPQLMDVRRFLHRFNIAKNVKSRDNATRIVFESLNRCSPEELNDFLSGINRSEHSPFSILAGHIMRDRGNKHASPKPQSAG